MNKNEKKLLTVLGKNPEFSAKELTNHTPYKWESSVARKIKTFKEQKYIMGPSYFLDCGKLSKNPIRKLMCFIELDQPQKTVMDYLQLIKPLEWTYPVLSSRKELLGLGILSSNDIEVEALFHLLKMYGIITDYTIRVRPHKLILENPNFFGDSVPSLDALCDPCEFPDISCGCHTTEWTQCDIRVLSYLHGNTEKTNLIDIMRKEKQVHDKKWGYDQIKYAYRKMCENNLIEKIYFVHPYPLHECADFYLFLKTDDINTTKNIVYNFGRDCRIHREYTLCDKWGLIGCICHPLFVVDLLHKLDQIPEITEKELFHLRSYPPGASFVGQHSRFDCFDIDTQTLEYPYHEFREKILVKLENDGFK
ncbi:MAG: hypothetical protein PVF58_07880 [Candidatus Methanofastidiosia archaeon]|jgi:hypothetical protein